MCFGSGPSAEEIYEKEFKKEPEPLPSLSMQKAKERTRKLKDVRRGAQRRSLLNPMMGGSYDANG